MESIVPPLSPAVWEATPPESQALIVALQAEVSRLRPRLGQDSLLGIRRALSNALLTVREGYDRSVVTLTPGTAAD